MFTGLAAAVGELGAVRAKGGGLTVTVKHALPDGPIEPGESVAVDGCCLTAVAPGDGAFDADLSPETLSRTGGRLRWRPGRAVNLERALRAGDRLGGHIVQGHVDGLLRVAALRRGAGGFAELRLRLPAAARRYVVPKGSIALDGISLTVAKLGGDFFEVAVIPATLAATTLGRRRAGDEMIVEWDVMLRAAAAAAFSPSGPR